MEIYEDLLFLLDDIGITFSDNDEYINLDSITFITMIIRIEEEFNISFPDDLLQISLVNTIRKLETIITNILTGEKENENN